MTITDTGYIKNNGYTLITNNPYNDYVEDRNTKLTIAGKIDTKGDLKIKNRGGNGLDITNSALINHDGNAIILNGYEGNETVTGDNQTGALNIAGTVNTTGNLDVTNTVHGVDGMHISGNINAGGKATYTNHGEGGLNVTKDGKLISNNLEMLNTGAGGLTINGNATNVGTATVTNKAGALNIGGTFTNTGDATFTNTDKSKDLNIDGTITNNNGKLVIDNQKAGHLNIDGKVTNNGTTTDILNAGDDGLNVTGLVHSNDKLTMTNTGANGILIDSSAKITGNKDIEINNTISEKKNPRSL